MLVLTYTCLHLCTYEINVTTVAYLLQQWVHLVDREQKHSFPPLGSLHQHLGVAESPRIDGGSKGPLHVHLHVFQSVGLRGTHLRQKTVDEHLKIDHGIFVNVQSRMDLLLDLLWESGVGVWVEGEG